MSRIGKLLIKIPEGVSKSYHGRISELYWEVKATVNIHVNEHLNAIAKIDIL